jgi:protoporphyrinogen/coproporphyrinogen III oxidase
MTPTPRVVIVGGGLSGLSLAYRIGVRLPTAQITVLEKAPRPGGNIVTIERDGFRVEGGPNGIFDAKPQTLQLCRDLGLADRLIPASESSRKHRYLFLDNRLRELPGSLWSFLTSPVLSWRGKASLLFEKYRKRPADLSGDETVAAFARRRAGDEAADILADAMVTGIHAGDAELLSVAAAFPRLVQFERQHGSVMRGFRAAARERRRAARARGEKPQRPQLWSFREGLGVLVDALGDRLGNSLHTGVHVRQIEQAGKVWTIRGEGREIWEADAVVLTTPAHDQAGIVAELDSELANEMQAIPYNRVAVVALGFRQADLPDRTPIGFGYIAPQKSRRDVLGVQWCSSIFPERAPDGMVLWRALCGGWHRAEIVDSSDERLVAAVREELRVAMGVAAAPAFVQIVRWPTAIPQYHVGHLDRVRRIEARVAALPGLFVGGNAYHGVAMNDCTEQAEILAGRVAGYIAG